MWLHAVIHEATAAAPDPASALRAITVSRIPCGSRQPNIAATGGGFPPRAPGATLPAARGMTP